MITKYSSVVIKVRYFLLIFMILLTMSCQLLNFREDIEIHLPRTDNQIFQGHDFHWIFQYRDSDGSLQTVLIESSRESLFFSLEKGLTQAFGLYAEFNRESGDLFHTKPAGFIYGYNEAEGGQYVFDWAMGFESSLLLDLCAYMNLEQINIPRLVETIGTEAECENHWTIDSHLILEELLAGEFRSYDIRKLREREVELTLPTGEWFNANLTGEDLFSESSFSSFQVEIFSGYSSYIHTSGLQLEIQVEDDGTFDYIIY